MSDGTRISDYAYDLPRDLIASYPADRRDASRLLMVPREGELRHGAFAQIPRLFRSGDLLVVNDSRVLPVRFLGRKPTGAPAEVLLQHPWVPVDGGVGRRARPEEIASVAGETKIWEALVRPGGKLKPGRTVVVSDELSIDVLGSTNAGNRVVQVVSDLTMREAMDRYGHVPLPPYIDRDDEPSDRERYQTVYAARAGSVAAPTAGLHFTRPVLGALVRSGVRRSPVTLHVGIGTFRPLNPEDDGKRSLHPEAFMVPEKTATAVKEAREAGGRVWAVGTTVVRALESVASDDGAVIAGSGWTDLFIRPPYDFRVIDGLVTNFHLPRSSLLMLVAAFAGYDRTMQAYREAIAERYRFYSYGDAMVILPPS